MRLSQLIEELKKTMRREGDREVHARDRDGDLQPVTGVDTLYGTKGKVAYEKLYLTTVQGYGEGGGE